MLGLDFSSFKRVSEGLRVEGRSEDRREEEEKEKEKK